MRATSRIVSVVAGLALLGTVLAGCGSSDNESSGEDKVLEIGVVAPLNAGLVDFGRGIRNSVQLAVDQANDNDTIPGWRIEVRALDDSSDPAVGEAAAKQLSADANLIGVVGTYNSGVAAKVAPVLHQAGVTMISPGNTDPALTVGPDPANPARPYDNYFRMVANDSVQAPFLADQAKKRLHATKAFVISETKPVSKGLADTFADVFGKDGGTVVKRTVVPDGTTDFVNALAGITAMSPDLIFFGGEYQVGAKLRAAATAAGLKVPMMGGDGLKDDSYITDAGAASEGDLASSIGAPAETEKSAKEFVAAYKAAAFKDRVTDFGPYAYDAANILIKAAAKALDGKKSVTSAVRTAIRKDVQATDDEGASGKLGFDAYGDTKYKVLTLYKVSGGHWTAEVTSEVS
jgi:branched-chain amino acid transport system substrate-binding protein